MRFLHRLISFPEYLRTSPECNQFPSGCRNVPAIFVPNGLSLRKKQHLLAAICALPCVIEYKMQATDVLSLAQE